MTMGRALPWLGVFLALVAGTPVARAAAPWQTLPPTPDLPATMRSGYLPVNGIRMWYAEFGVGKPVLLLHGGLANSNYWGHLVPFLVAHHRTVIVADSRGHGRSTRSSQPFGYDLMASDILRLLDRLHLAKVDLVGWSDGGIIGLDLAMHDPDRIDHLFAFGANTDPSGLNKGFARSPVFAAFILRARQEYQALSPTPDQYDLFVRQIGHMWQSEPHWTRADLAAITVPTTIADGDHDEAISQAHDRFMADAIPGARLVILPDVGHFAMLQWPDPFDQAVLTALSE
ncbi:alpha/beta fold hydrolase [Lichenicola sp.]|uniref:alpha/beta fold hydrolase n=1 Tax=Lichenicola sp. TaxID=2804529 RepID=UPI003B00C871